MKTTDLLHHVRTTLHLNQLELATSLGASRRTGQRWAAGQSAPSQSQWRALARRVYPVHEALARELAIKGETSLDMLGLVSPVPATPAPAPTITAMHLIDAIVCASATAVAMSPQSVRPAIAAAFARAAEMGLNLDAVDAAFRKAQDS